MRCAKHFIGEAGSVSQAANECMWRLARDCHTKQFHEHELANLQRLSPTLYGKLIPSIPNSHLPPEAILHYPRLEQQKLGLYPPSFRKICSHAEHGMSSNREQRTKLFTEALQDLTEMASRAQAAKQETIATWPTKKQMLTDFAMD